MIDRGSVVERATGWFQVLWEVLQTDDQACLGLIRSAGGRDEVIELVDGATSTEDALAYARTLSELGFVAEAWDVFCAVVDAAFASWAPEAAVA
jgi:hypothetical protein